MLHVIRWHYSVPVHRPLHIHGVSLLRNNSDSEELGSEWLHTDHRGRRVLHGNNAFSSQADLGTGLHTFPDLTDNISI